MSAARVRRIRHHRGKLSRKREGVTVPLGFGTVPSSKETPVYPIDTHRVSIGMIGLIAFLCQALYGKLGIHTLVDMTGSLSMDWSGLGLRDHVVEWLEHASSTTYADSRRLDPFATSMRDFDDVSADLRSIQKGERPNRKRWGQRLTDLRGAGLARDGAIGLSKLGKAVLKVWAAYGVANQKKSDEFARHLLLILEARRLGDLRYLEFLQYWKDLRTYFDGLALISRWDALYCLNYLDNSVAEFAPGSIYRDEAVPVREVSFDLTAYATDIAASPEAIKGAKKIERAIRGQIPRGRHRATFCMALEIVVSEGQHTLFILDRFGLPKSPGKWAQFDKNQKGKILDILRDYGAEQQTAADDEVGDAGHKDHASENAVYGIDKPAELPIEIDFEVVLVEPPQPKAPSGKKVKSKSGKIDGVQKARANSATGKLGEDFTIRYERWRLREHPALLEKIRHVSQEDDNLGYDIHSFELDGSPRFVEVKGTLGPLESRFFLSANELQAAEQKGASYVILRVAQLPGNPVCCEIRYPFDGKLDLVVSNYGVTFRAVGK